MNKANNMQTKKVFSAAKYLDSMMEIGIDAEILIPAINPKGWVWQCDGKTPKECRAIGFAVINDWCIEIPQNENIDFATMATCKDCLHYNVCLLGAPVYGVTGTCLNFNNKSEWIHLPCKKGDVLERNGERCEVDHWNVIVTTFTEDGKLRLFGVE